MCNPLKHLRILLPHLIPDLIPHLIPHLIPPQRPVAAAAAATAAAGLSLTPTLLHCETNSSVPRFVAFRGPDPILYADNPTPSARRPPTGYATHTLLLE